MPGDKRLQGLNYHHLRYFREVAHEGNLTRVAERLNLSQSALSTQIRTLEERLGQTLFDRVGRQLVLTEVGRIALDYADRIFGTGEELMAVLQRQGEAAPPLRVGAVSTLSRNFQLQFLRPVLAGGAAAVDLKSGSESVLYEALTSLAIDVLLTAVPPHGDRGAGYTAHRIAEQSVQIHGTPGRLRHQSLRALLEAEPLIVPTEAAVATGFDGLVARLGVRPRIVAEVDDMAMVRLLAREDVGLAVAPAVVLEDEIASGQLRTAPFDLNITERFYAVTTPRNFPHPALAGLLAAQSA